MSSQCPLLASLPSGEYPTAVHFEFLGIVGIMDEIPLGFPPSFQATAAIVAHLGHGLVFPSAILSRHSCIFLIRRHAA